jgi:3-methyladenine DNA glycosylase AlkD
MQVKEVIKRLNSLSNPKRVEDMKRFGIKGINFLGISMPEIRKLGKEIGKNHTLALDLWSSGIHEAKLLAGFIDDPKLVSEEQMDNWAEDFDSWDIVDSTVGSLFEKTEFARKKALEWRNNDHEYIKRAAFVLMLRFAIGKKKVTDDEIAEFLPMIVEGAYDERNMVKKAVNWALRQIGKKNLFLNKKAIKTGEEILKIGTKHSNWIANHALRELRSDKIQERLHKQSKKIKR